MNWFTAWQRRMNRRKYGISARFAKAKLASRITLLVFLGLAAAIVCLVILFAWYAKDLPRPDGVVRKEGFSTKIYDRSGELLYDVFSNQRRTPINIAQVPQHLKNATVAVEDKNFYHHQGFDPKGILRAVFNIIFHGKIQGGSTLTQQLVKNTLLTQQRTLPRKIKEFILAVQIESKYSKDEILQMYLNESPYGGTAWGVQAAAEVYFNKDVSELNLLQSAILVGLPQRPSYYSPFSGEQGAYVGRTDQVLKRMVEDGYITKLQEEEAKKELATITFASPAASFKAPHFVMYVKAQLEERYGQKIVEQGGLRVTTSLDNQLQEEAQKIVAEEIAKTEKLNITNGAAIIINPQTGEILSMVGSKNYDDPNYDGKVNVVLSLRQPGSAIKPVTYVTAFKKGYTAATMLIDTKTVFPVVSQPDYEPTNYDGKFHGPLSIRNALGNSINLPAVKTVAKLGLKDILTTAEDLGLSTLAPTEENLRRLGLSVTLGGGEVRLLELASAYSAFANTGLKVEPVSILKVTDRDGKVLEEFKPITGKRVLTPQQAFLISDILSDNKARLITFGERSAINVADRKVAVKTGTTNDRRDNWTIGWTPQIVVGVWVGNNDNQPMKQLSSGVSGAAPIWRRIILQALKDKPALSFPMPEGIVTAEVDSVSGNAAHDGYPSRPEYFISGTEPSGEDTIHTKLKVCRGQDKLATPAQISRGDYEEKEYFVFKEEDLVSKDGINRWQEGINQWLVTQTDSRYHPPTDYCGSQEEMAVNIAEPKNEQQLTGNEVKLRAEVTTANRVMRVEFFVNNEQKDETTMRPYEKVFTLANGPYTLKVKAFDEKGNQAEANVKIGVNVPWDWQPSPTPTAPVTPTPSPSPTPLPTSPTP